MKNKKSAREKISLKKIISNVRYVLGFALRADKKTVILFILADCFFTAANILFDTLLIKTVIDLLWRKAPLESIILAIGAGFLLLGTAVVVVNSVESLTRARIVRMTGSIQREFLEKATRMDLICYDRPEYFNDFVIAASQSGEMINNSIFCTSAVFAQTLGVLLSGGIIFTINPIIAIFPIVGFIVNIITRFSISKTEYEMEIKRIDRKTNYSRRVFYQPEYAKEIKLTGISDALRKQHYQSLCEQREAAKKYGIKIALLSLVNWIVVFTLLSYFCVPVYLGYLALVAKKITMGDVASMNNASNSVRNLLDGMNYALVGLQKVGLFADRFRRFTEYKENLETFTGDEAIPERAALEIKNMSYKYDGEEEYALKNINMSIKAGEKIAIVGENGAGKTTLIKLIMRLYDVSEGEIDFGGRDIRGFTTKKYRDRISAVFQDYQIYASTLGENVMMDCVGEDNREKIAAALEKADFTDKLARLPENINTELTREFAEDGTVLSGGESQKVAISRIFAKDGKTAVSILDEPSSALDPIAEYNLNCSMMENADDSTIIFISHRLSTTRDADRIYMFEHGEIIEQGTHDELMALGGEYAEMFEKQAHYYKLNAI